jgi:predicted nucleotidyltransferase
MFSVRPDRSVELLTLNVLEVVASVAAQLELQWFVVGAMARDIVLSSVFGLDTGRATRDVDLAVAVASWQQFAELRQRLLNTTLFHEAKGLGHRLYYPPQPSGHGHPMDVIPFGGIQDKKQSIAWPPDMSEIMSVAGYEEAFGAAIEVEIRSDLVIRVASLPGLATLKIFAWNDRGDVDAKDATDLATLLRRYVDAGNMERLYGSELTVLEAVDYAVELASPRLLGRDVRRIVSVPTAEKLEEILSRRGERLISDMARTFPGVDDSIAEAERLLDQFRAGLRNE